MSIPRMVIGLAVVAAISLALRIGGEILGARSAGTTTTAMAGTIETCIIPGGDCVPAVVRAIEGATGRVWVLGYGFTEPAIANALIAASRRKGADGKRIDVRVVLDQSNQKEPYSLATNVRQAGIVTLIDSSVKIMHHKVVVIGDDTVLLGSMNWTKASRHNAENMNIIRGNRALTATYAAVFQDRAAHAVPFVCPATVRCS